MRTILISLIVFFCAYTHTLSAQSGTTKDLFTGLKVTYKGISVEEAYLMNADQVKIKKKSIKVGDKFTIVVAKPKGWKEVDGVVSLGLDMKVFDPAGTILLDAKDLYKDKSYDKKTAESYLDAIFTTGKPMEVGKKYKFTAHFYDKNNPKVSIDCEVTLLAE